jgi:hypothetical protein
MHNLVENSDTLHSARARARTRTHTHNAFICFVRFSEQRVIFSYAALTIFTTELECVYCAVRTQNLIIIQKQTHN